MPGKGTSSKGRRGPARTKTVSKKRGVARMGASSSGRKGTSRTGGAKRGTSRTVRAGRGPVKKTAKSKKKKTILTHGKGTRKGF